MFRKLTLASVIAVAGVAAIAKDSFSSPYAFLQDQFELYPIEPEETVEEYNLQYKCQYIAGLEIFDLQTLALANPV